MDPDTVAGRLRDDVSSGAAEIAENAVRAFEAALAQSGARDVDELRGEQAAVAARVIGAQPAMAPLVALSASVLRAVSGTATLEVARKEATNALEEFRQRLQRSTEEVAARAEGLVPAGGRVLTLSASSTVRLALRKAARHRSFDVICLESRPRLEGRAFAASLAEAGVRVTLAVDAAIAAMSRGCDLMLVGVDSIGDAGVVNKIGTRAAAQSARGAGIPIYALADRSKLLPPGFPQPLEDSRPASEVWPDAPPGVVIWNHYFEATPLRHFAGIVTEDGLHNPAELDERRLGIDLPVELRPKG